jgi:hypothetical protein
MIVQTAIQTLKEIQTLLLKMNNTVYTYQCENIEHSSIGMHVRHSLEMLDCLVNQYELNYVNYDERKRDKMLENDIASASSKIDDLILKMDKPDKAIEFKSNHFMGETDKVNSNYYRELIYNIEHCIHHQALIKVVLKRFPEINIPQHFGIAPSTIEYQESQKKNTSSS